MEQQGLIGCALLKVEARQIPVGRELGRLHLVVDGTRIPFRRFRLERGLEYRHPSHADIVNVESIKHEIETYVRTKNETVTHNVPNPINI